MVNPKSANSNRGQILANELPLNEKLLGNQVLPQRANAGLVFDRLLPIWDGPAENAPKPLNGGMLALKDFVSDFAKTKMDGQKRIAELQQRQERMINRLGASDDSWSADMTGSERLVIGMGADHPLENGFTFHPLYGIPYLPGSSIKGLIRAAAKLQYGDESPDWILRALGSEHSPGVSSKPGDIIVLDAFPATWPELVVDLINCHHPKYYGKPWELLPVETESPVPVYFLAVEQGASWRFRLVRRKRGTTELEKIGELLKEGLQWLGIGGKTAVGYGRME